MKLDQKYFAPFIGICAIITMVFIVLASFNFKGKQDRQFRENTEAYSQLLVAMHPSINEADSIRLGDFSGKRSIVLFWASWSEKSEAIMQELDIYSGNENYEVIAALVMDATETAEALLPNHEFTYIDGTRLFNDLKVPGIPSYFLLDENGNLVSTEVGYHEGVVLKINELYNQ